MFKFSHRGCRLRASLFIDLDTVIDHFLFLSIVKTLSWLDSHNSLVIYQNKVSGYIWITIPKHAIHEHILRCF